MKFPKINLSKNVVFFFSMLGVFASVTSNFASNYYVAENGADNNPGTLSQPWMTINKANLVLQAGDTLYIREGVYNEEIRPAHSGSEGNYIVYTNYNDEQAIIDRKSNQANCAINISGRTFIIINGLILINAKRLVEGWDEGFSHCIIQNNIMKYGGTGIRMKNGSNYNKILNNYIELQTQDEIDANIENDALWMRDCSYNLIEGNEISHGGHKNIEIRGHSSYNIFRNNIIHSSGDGHFNNTDGISSHIVIEGNMWIGIILTPDGFGSGISRNGNPHSIIRNNVIYWLEGPFAHGIGFNQPYGDQPWTAAEHVRVYNNTIANGYQYCIRVQYAHEDLTWMHKDFIVKNNIIQKCNDYVIYENGYGNKPYDVIFSNNLIRGNLDGQKVISIQGYTSKTLSEAESIWPTYFKNNIESDPIFEDELGHDYRLKYGSPCIDAGSHLTKTISSGTGTQIKVEDAYYFHDGYYITDGDLIQLEGQNERARIIKIDYNNNILTIDRSLSWFAGQGVSLAYNGKAPDIGAYESDYSATSGPIYLIHNTFEQDAEGWSGAIGNTAYNRDNSTSYADSYSMHVYATGAESKLSIGVNPVAWNVDQYPFLSVAYKIPSNVPVGIFFNTDAGWICLGGAKKYNSGGYPNNDAYSLADDDSWHIIILNVRDKIREVYPSVNTVTEFEWYTQNNGKQEDEFWFDEVMILADNNAPPTASVSLTNPSPIRAGIVEVILMTSKNVAVLPTPLIFTESDRSTTLIDLQGAIPGTTFTGAFDVNDAIAEGVGYFSLNPDALVDEQGNTGNEITSGTYVRIDKTPPAKPKNLIARNIHP